MRVTADGTNYTFGDATDIMPNYAGDCPAVPQGESSEYSISPDEKFIAYATQPGVVSSWSVRMHIYLYPIPAEGSTEPVACLQLHFITSLSLSFSLSLQLYLTHSLTRILPHSYIRSCLPHQRSHWTQHMPCVLT